MTTWSLTHLLVEHPIIFGVGIVVVTIAFVLGIWLEDKEK
jgi:hypothetical protein